MTLLWLRSVAALCFAGLLGLGASHALALEDCAPGAFARIALTSDQIIALDNHRGENRMMDFVEGVVDGKKRLVVFVGETHINDAQTFGSGRAIIDAFPVRGVEGFNGSLAWKAMKDFGYLVESIRTLRTSGSLIPYAYSGEKLAGKIDKIVARYGLESMSKEKLKKFKHTFNDVTYTGEELLRLKELAPKVKTIHLEAGHRPTATERGAAWAVTSAWAAYRLWAVPALVTLPAVLGGDLVTPAIGAATSLLALAGTTWARDAAITLGNRTLRIRRDEVMSENILTHFRNHPDDEVMLVVVGQGHVTGIRSQLGKQGFDFSKFPHDSVEQLRYERRQREPRTFGDINQ